MYQNEAILDFLHNEMLTQLPTLASYGRKYKQYLKNNCSTITIKQIRKQLSFFNPSIIDTAELLCEKDILSQINSSEEHDNFSKRVNHIYNERYFFLSSFKSSNSFSAFIYWLSELIKGGTIKNCEVRASSSLAFKLALDVYINHFQHRGMLH